MRYAFGLLTFLLWSTALPPHSQAQTDAAALAPSGPLRVGLVEAPSESTLFVVRTPDGTPRGVTVDLANDLAATIGRPVAASIFPNTGEATRATQAGTIDVTFMPVDEERRRLVGIGPGYYRIESTYLVTGASGITDVGGVDRPAIRVIAISGTSTFRASSRTLRTTQPTPLATVAEAIEWMREGRADAFALSRDTLQPVLAQVPGARITAGSFQQTEVAVAVPKDRPAALALVSAWMTQAKQSGLVRRLFDAHGFSHEAVAP